MTLASPEGAQRVPADGADAAALHSALALEVLGHFREVFRAAKLHFGAVHKTVGVSGAQLWALAEVGTRPGLRVSDLAARMSLRQSTVSNMIEQLARAGYLLRERGDQDRRVVHLRLTLQGETVLAQAPRPARGVLPDALESLPLSDLQALADNLKQVLSRMKVRAPDAATTHFEQL